MNIAIDFGNTRIKAGHFVKDELKNNFVFDNEDQLLSYLKSSAPGKIIIASVTNIHEDILTSIKNIGPSLIFLHNTPIPVTNKYKSASTLGSDRLASAIGGNFYFRNQNLLVVDAGTCIKYNFVNNKNEYLGGGISPGLQMRFKALHKFTAKLPLISYDKEFTGLIGTNTEESIRMGVQIGLIAEVKEVIRQYIQKFPDINIVLTGGDASVLQKELKNDIFADPYLILKGLNCVLN